MKPKEGEIICPECKGKGQHPEVNKGGFIIRYLTCPKCQGSGKLDWVEMVVGKRYRRVIDLSEYIPDILFNRSIEEIISESMGIPKKYLGFKI